MKENIPADEPVMHNLKENESTHSGATYPKEAFDKALEEKKAEIKEKAQAVAEEAILPNLGDFFSKKNTKEARAAIIRKERDAVMKSAKLRKKRRKAAKASRKINRKK